MKSREATGGHWQRDATLGRRRAGEDMMQLFRKLAVMAKIVRIRRLEMYFRRPTMFIGKFQYTLSDV